MVEGMLPVPVVQVELPFQLVQARTEVRDIQTWNESIPSGVIQAGETLNHNKFYKDR